MNKEWEDFFIESNLLDSIKDNLNLAYSFQNTAPKKEDVLKLFRLTKPKEIKCIILGQDPYFNLGQADGIAFSNSNPNIKFPPSLKNIFKELEKDLGIVKNNGDLEGWVKQGVFLINTIWTVEIGKPNSHKKIGWEKITIKIIEELLNRNSKIIVCLFGNSAKTLYNNIVKKSDYVLESSHPSPLGAYRTFFGSRPFSKINYFLEKENLVQIDWSL